MESRFTHRSRNSRPINSSFDRGDRQSPQAGPLFLSERGTDVRHPDLLVVRLSSSKTAIADRAWIMRPAFPLPQIASRDLDIAVIGLLLPANLALGDEFEPGPMKMIGFKAAFRREPFG